MEEEGIQAYNQPRRPLWIHTVIVDFGRALLHDLAVRSSLEQREISVALSFMESQTAFVPSKSRVVAETRLLERNSWKNPI